MLTAKSQDTLHYSINKTTVYQWFNDEIDIRVSRYEHNNDIYFDVKTNEILKLHLYDNKLRTRKFTTTYPNGNVTINILDSKNNVYFSPLGPIKIEIGNAKFIQKL